MTSIDRFDPFEQRITAAIGEIAAPRRPDYLEGILRQTARTSQRPRWTFPARWLPAPAAGSGRSVSRQVVGRTIVLLVVLAALVAGAAIVGSRLVTRSDPGPGRLRADG